MKRQPIDPRQASLAATFYEPVYQRLRQPHLGHDQELLCFVNQTTDKTQKFLADCGAVKSNRFRAPCFAEVWELPHDILQSGPFQNEPSEFDRRLSEAMGCHAGKYSARVGQLTWSRTHEQDMAPRQYQSALLREAFVPRTRKR